MPYHTDVAVKWIFKLIYIINMYMSISISYDAIMKNLF